MSSNTNYDFFRQMNGSQFPEPLEVSTYNVHQNGQNSINVNLPPKNSVIKNGVRDQNGYRRGASTGSSSSPLSTASSSGSTVISR